MTQPEKRSGALLSALRDDLPSQQDEARVRLKLTTAGLTLGAATTTANLAHAAALSTAKVVSTSSAPAGVALGGTATVAASKAVAVSKVGAVVTTTWASFATGTKLAVVSVAVAGGAYPAVSYWTTRSEEVRAAAPQAAKVTASTLPPLDIGSNSASTTGWNRASSTRPNSTTRSPENSTAGADGITKADVLPSSLDASVTRNTAPVLVQRSTVEADSPAIARRVNSGTAPTRRTQLLAHTAAKVGPHESGATENDGTENGARAGSMVGHRASAPTLAPPVDLRLREETVLIERALVAARTNDKAAAARWLGEHEQRFPTGILVRERERLRASLR